MFHTIKFQHGAAPSFRQLSLAFLTFTLTACGSVTTSYAEKLGPGIIEIKFDNIGTEEFNASVRDLSGTLSSQAVTYQPSTGLTFSITSSTGTDIDTNGDAVNDTRYLRVQAQVQNNTGGTLTNLTLMGIGNPGAGSVFGTAYTNPLTVGGAAAPQSLVQQIKPTHGLTLVSGKPKFAIADADFVALTETETSGLLPTVQTNVPGVQTVFPFGYLVSLSTNQNSRSLANGTTGLVTIGVRLPKQTTSSNDLNSFGFLFTFVVDTQRRVTQVPDQVSGTFIEDFVIDTMDRVVRQSGNRILAIGAGERIVSPPSSATRTALTNLRIAGTSTTDTNYRAITTTGTPTFFLTTSGGLDTKFDIDGKLTATFNANESNGASSLVIDTQGRLVLGGYNQTSGNPDFALARYVNGVLDTSFSGDGKQVTNIATGSKDYIYDIALNSQGKIIAAGSTETNGNTNFALVRYNVDGSLDTTFDIDGIVVTDFSATTDEQISAIAIDSQSKIIAAGFSRTGSTYSLALARYNTNGSLDTTFDGDGRLTLTSIFDASDVVLDSSGRIVIVGSSGTGANFDFAVARFTTSGVLDTSFSGDGIVTTAISSLFDAATSVALDSSGRIVVGGYSLGGVRTNDLNRDFVVARYTTAGVLDTAFSGDGIITSDLGSLKDTLTSLAIDKNGRIVASGSTKAATGNTVIALTRYTAAGVLDTAFDTDGIVTTALGTLYDSASAIAFDSYNRIVLAGSTQTTGSTLLNTDEDLAITRYWP